MTIKNTCKMVTKNKPHKVTHKTTTKKVFKSTILANVIVLMLLSSTISTGAPISSVNRLTTVTQCAKNFDFIPARYRHCTEVVPSYCFKHVDVCYPIDGLSAVMPCLKKQYYPGISHHISRCTVLAKLKFTKNGLACSTVDDLKAFYECFNDGK